jgi:hypothetical protein
MKALQNSLYIYGRGGEDQTLFEIRTLEIFVFLYYISSNHVYLYV